jgi:CubicO group peptidase (beta-lactamase class C family)
VTAAGYVAAGFEPVAAAFESAQESDRGGAQLCIYLEGTCVVDLHAGRDPVNGRPYAGDTLTVLMSCTKGLLAVCAHRMIQRGLLDPDAPVARYWPEFADGGKAAITVAQVLDHSAGLAAFEPDHGIDATVLLDWSRCVQALAAMRPLWPPGSAVLYHFVTWGYLVGELLERVSGRPVGTLIRDEIAGPLGIDLWVGLPATLDARVAPHFRSNERLTGPILDRLFEQLGADRAARLVRAMRETMLTTEALIDLMREPIGRRAVVPAGNGVGNARGLARMYAACLGPVDGIRLLAADTVRHARQPRTDQLAGPPPFTASGSAPQRFGLGFELPRSTLPMLGPSAFGHPGAGGRLAYADPESGCAVAYVCNNLVWDGQNADPRWLPWSNALQAIVDRARSTG